MATTEPQRHGTRLARCLAAATIVGALSVVAGTAPQLSAAKPPRDGCARLNLLSNDGQYSALIGTAFFSAGQTVIVTASAPAGVPTPTSTRLFFNVKGSDEVDSGGFPNTLSYTVPADGRYSFEWQIRPFVDVNTFATWQVSCTQAPACTMTGTSGRDVLVGTEGADVICGLGNRDVIDARGGNDVVFGGAGGDSIRGGSGQDQLFGETGADSIDSRDGAPGDIVAGSNGQDSVVEDPGDTVTQ
jgi:Ca2+-binding RTX toxin-like protein